MADGSGVPSAGGTRTIEIAELLDDQVVAAESALLELERDPQGMLHDARVALRKLRGSLRVYAPLLDQEAAKPLRRELTWLAKELGPARDAQVVLERIRRGVAKSGTDDVAAKELLVRFEADAEQASAEVRRTLRSDRFFRLIARLDVARLRSLMKADATQSPRATGDDLRQLLRDLQDAEHAADEHLHDLRKVVKQVRYVRGSGDRVDAALRRIQSVLGEHQDSVVARDRLNRLPRHELDEMVTDLADELTTREGKKASRSQHKLRKAVRKLDKALP